MPAGRIIGAIILFIMAGILAFLSFRSFKEKGFLFNNAYLYATEEERQWTKSRGIDSLPLLFVY